MSVEKRLEDAQRHVQAAEKSLKTSLLKWRPDYDVAADEYNKAATFYRNAKAYDECRTCLLKAVDCHKQNKSWFHAAKCLDQAILIAKEMGNFPEVKSLAFRASDLYAQHGSASSGSSSLEKAGKILETEYPRDALDLFQKAADIAVIEDSERQAAEYVSKAARLLVRLKRYDEAADAIRREIGLQQQVEAYQAIGRLTVALVLVQLARGDIVAAEKSFKEWGNCCDAPEAQTLETLLQAFDDEDPEAAMRALKDPFIRHMDVDYAKLARDMPLPQGIVQPKASVIENAAGSYVSPNAASSSGTTTAVVENSASAGDNATGSTLKGDEEDDYEGGLC